MSPVCVWWMGGGGEVGMGLGGSSAELLPDPDQATLVGTSSMEKKGDEK